MTSQKRGVVGLLALLAVFILFLYVPFMKKLNTTNDEIKLIATLGVAHILSVMIYGLSRVSWYIIQVLFFTFS